ncbi:hypothetical protein [Streptomyces sp. NPDC026092]|uniref:hypothetical protein n=1 Tax=Streptomyces sp. NPDC026092 TaxID=3154797 RepID=UPI0033CA4BA7
MLDAIVDHKRVAVPAAFGVGKTYLAARAAVWFTNVYPVGTALCITTATRFRQVQRQLWPHIRKVVPRAGLPGYCDTVRYKMPDPYGNDVVAAYGFSARPMIRPRCRAFICRTCCSSSTRRAASPR